MLNRSGEADRLTVGTAAILGFLLVALVILVALSGGTWRAAALLRDTVEPPPDIEDRISAETVSISPDLSARLYRPVDAAGPLPAFVVVHGAVGQGPDDPRQVALSQALAARGATVVAPILESLADFKLDVEDPKRIVATIEWLATQTDLAVDQQVALFGISIGGSYGLLASADDAVAEHVSTVMVFGGYHDLGPFLSQWLTDPIDSDPVLDPFREGRWLVLLGNVEAAVDEADIDTVTSCLEALLAASGCEVNQPVGRRAQLVLEAALSESAVSSENAAALLESFSAAITALSPSEMVAPPEAPIYLLHAVNDPVVPTGDTDLVAATLEQLGADVTVQITDVFEHVDTDTSPSLFEAWPLVRFVGAFLDDAGL